MFEECVHIPKDPSVTNKSDIHASLPNVLQRQVVHGHSEAVMFSSKTTLSDSGMQKYGQWNSAVTLTYLLGL